MQAWSEDSGSGIPIGQRRDKPHAVFYVRCDRDRPRDECGQGSLSEILAHGPAKLYRLYHFLYTDNTSSWAALNSYCYTLLNTLLNSLLAVLNNSYIRLIECRDKDAIKIGKLIEVATNNRISLLAASRLDLDLRANLLIGNLVHLGGSSATLRA
ncbi:hypothetical protein BDZ85DRAFT_303809 [Elsinoe ampelina]|uniref:Uncharacterized protein n=1 Tax=Elsinoe ampelina TaxID=302913 RepID=A0A6A6G2G5_9PEZI|nr:hypothetical protein BDZ85DRAFT_303809 [Elsinoe ampelina]